MSSYEIHSKAESKHVAPTLFRQLNVFMVTRATVQELDTKSQQLVERTVLSVCEPIVWECECVCEWAGVGVARAMERESS